MTGGSIYMKQGNLKRTITTFALTACLLVPNAVPSVVVAADNGGNGYPQDIRTFDKIEKKYEDGFAGKIVVLQSNDSHGDVDDFKFVKPLEDYFIKKDAQVLTVDCGDYSQTRSGTKIVEKSEGISALKIMESAGYDVIALGNHEFDYFHEDEKGNNLLQERLDTVKIDALCANIIDTDTNKRVAKQHNCVKTVKVPASNTSVNIGFFGVDTGETTDDGHASSDYSVDLKVYTGDKLVDCAKKEIADLRNTGDELDNEKNPTADIIICLAHLGVDEARMNKDSSTLLYNGLKKANANVDVLVNLYHVFYPHRPTPKFNVLPLFGVGTAYTFGFQKDKLEIFSRPAAPYIVNTKADFYPSLRIGFLLSYWLSKRLELQFDAHFDFIDDKYNGVIDDRKYDGYTVAMLGLAYKFKRGTRRYENRIEHLDDVVEVNRMNNELELARQNLEKAKVKDTLLRVNQEQFLEMTVSFIIDKFNITDVQRPNVEAVAAYINSHPEVDVVICGFADVNTAYPAYNMRLSKRRVTAVYNMLTQQFGVDPKRLSIDYKGDTEQPYDLKYQWNRVVVFKLTPHNEYKE